MVELVNGKKRLGREDLMFFMYVDESGDVGMGPKASRYFCLSGLVIHECNWTETLQAISGMRRNLAKEYGFDAQKELHASNLLGRSSKAKCGLTRTQIVLMLRDVIRFEAGFKFARSLNVVVDKKNKSFGDDPFTIAWETLIQRFENTINYNNFPTPWGNMNGEKGFIIVDKTDEDKLRKLVRRMRRNNIIPSTYGPGTYQSNLVRIIEDPMHKDSVYSSPIQLCDVNAYFLKQTVDPNTTVIKNKARNYFYYLKPILCTQACSSNMYGIVYR